MKGTASTATATMAYQRTRQVVYPDAHIPQSHPNSVNHRQPRHPRGNGCSLIPETHAPPTNAAPPAARAAALQPDNPETYTKAPALDQLTALGRQIHPHMLRWENYVACPRLNKGGERGADESRPAHPLLVIGDATASRSPILPTELPVEHATMEPAQLSARPSANTRLSTRETKSTYRRSRGSSPGRTVRAERRRPAVRARLDEDRPPPLLPHRPLTVVPWREGCPRPRPPAARSDRDESRASCRHHPLACSTWTAALPPPPAEPR